MEVLENLRLVELRNQPDASYMEKQKEITGAMRAILVDWMVEVHTAFEMVGETLYLAVNLVDRHLEHAGEAHPAAAGGGDSCSCGVQV